MRAWSRFDRVQVSIEPAVHIGSNSDSICGSAFELQNAGSQPAFLTLNGQPIEVDFTGYGDINVLSQSNWNGSDIVNGDTSLGYASTGIGFNDPSYGTPYTYDLTSNTFANVGSVYAGQNVTLKINSADAAGVQQFYGGGTGTLLQTSDATLDLTHTKVTGMFVTSSNALGTTFTVGDLGTALQIQGGPGNDTLVAQGFTFTADQRNAIFKTSSIETITDQSGTYETVICFMQGTLVRTPSGEMAVETLNRGDLVITADGRTVMVDWLGVQTISLKFADKLRVLPIRIKTGALAENIPSRDLLVSPDHAIFIDGALIQAGALVNGTSIVREMNVPTTFTYYHVEVEDHSLILAENTPAETFVDNIDRLHFDNWAEHEALYPEGKPINELPYPRAKSHRQVPMRTRMTLAARAQAILGDTGEAA